MVLYSDKTIDSVMIDMSVPRDVRIFVRQRRDFSHVNFTLKIENPSNPSSGDDKENLR